MNLSISLTPSGYLQLKLGAVKSLGSHHHRSVDHYQMAQGCMATTFCFAEPHSALTSCFSSPRCGWPHWLGTVHTCRRPCSDMVGCSYGCRRCPMTHQGAKYWPWHITTRSYLSLFSLVSFAQVMELKAINYLKLIAFSLFFCQLC